MDYLHKMMGLCKSNIFSGKKGKYYYENWLFMKFSLLSLG